MKLYLVKRDGDRDLRFTGTLLAAASTSPNSASSSYSGSVGRWTELALYQTKSGKYVAVRVERTQWQGSHDTYEAAVCADPLDVVDFLGYGRLAKELYDEACMDYAEDVE